MLIFKTQVSAQISVGGEPLCFDKSTQLKISKIVPVVTMPDIDFTKLIAEDIVNDNDKNIPWRFGENVDVAIDVINTGVKDILPDGTKTWRLQIYAKGALSLNFRFSKYNIPTAAKLFIYNPETKFLLGAFTSFNNQKDGVFATTLIEGESVIIVYEEPANAAFRGELVLDKVTHGYRRAYSFAKIFGSSGACNKNVTCPEGNSWENQIKSVCMLVVNGNGFCSGALINNTSNNGIPYVLTANHCTTSHGNFSSWVFWFNWQSDSCANPASSPQHQSISGCTLKAREGISDFCLVQMNNIPPANYNIYYSGWNISGLNTPNGACIHHPNGDIKKISIVGDSIKPEAYESIQCWRANWAVGVTEPGSSGSPLFDAQHRIIGQLYGGPSSCNVVSDNMHDYYGMISVSWNGISPDKRLKDWLDSTNTGASFIDGYDPVLTQNDAQLLQILSPSYYYCSMQPIVPKVIIKNHGINILSSCLINYKTDQYTTITTAWNGSLNPEETDTVYLPAFDISSDGSHTFSAYTSAPNNENDTHSENDTMISTFYLNGVNLPFYESFENAVFPPIGWTINNPDSSITWSKNNSTGLSGNHAAYINLFADTSQNNIDELLTPAINLPISHAELTFYLAYRKKDMNSNDTLKVFISTNCGATFSNVPALIFPADSLAFGTIAQSTAYVPSNLDEWKKITIPLESYSGHSIVIKFASISGNGNNLFIDNIMVNYGVGIGETIENTTLTFYPNPVNDLISFSGNDNLVYTADIIDNTGKMLQHIKGITSRSVVRLHQYPEGLYFILLKSGEKQLLKKIAIVR